MDAPQKNHDIASTLLALGLWIFLTSALWADKVILKDGKIYEGKIVAVTDGDVLIRTPPVNPLPKLLPGNEILTILRDPVAQQPKDPQRYTSINLGLEGNVFSSKNISLEPATSLRLGGGLRFHPLVEIGGGLEWKPAVSGALAITDGTTTRGYEQFYSYGGGFDAKLYPLYLICRGNTEPFLIVGYEWTRLIPNASGDSLHGEGLEGGFGIQRLLVKNLFMEGMFLYHHTAYDTLDFQGREGTPEPGIRADSYTFSAGLSIHL